MVTNILTPKYRVELTVEKRKHFYDVFLEGQEERVHRFPGVTGHLEVINKPALINWAKNEALAHVEAAILKHVGDSPVHITKDWINQVIEAAKGKPEQVKDDAADLGTRAHACIDLIIHGAEPKDIPSDILAPVDAFKKWWRNSGIELVKGDTKVASILHQFGGSLDALGKKDGKFIILDWKTSNGIYKEMALQVSAYAQAFYETYGFYCQEGIIVRFSKKRPIEFEVRRILDLEKSFKAFLNAKKLKESLDIEHFEADATLHQNTKQAT